MIKNLILLAVIYFVYRTIKTAMLKGADKDLKEQFGNKQGSVSDDVMIKDPYCGVYFPQRDGISLKKGSETLYFCSDQCRDEYKKSH